MKNKFLIFFILFSQVNLFAQIKGFYSGNILFKEESERTAPIKKSNTIGLYIGMANYLGDLGGNTGKGKSFFYDNNFKQRNFFYGFSFTHTRKEAIGFRFQYNTGKISGSDQDVQYTSTNDNAYSRYKRNLDFKTKISEASLNIELYPFKMIPYKLAMHHFFLQPYFMLGIGVYSFNPQGSYYDEIADDYVWVDLKPLRTEGQGMKEYPFVKEYKLTQMNIPFGVGLKFPINDKVALGIEFQGRKIFTDYLDDVSTNFVNPSVYSKYLDEENATLARTLNNKSNIIDPDNPYMPRDKRGNPNNNDFYYSFNFTFSVRISKLKEMTKVFNRKVYKYDDNELCN